ncbi:hypothetical protein I302_107046 [Kwoniella bestiolae CBS 10118]|uniref:Uncharacterized protein n=1 Tax=Kwoniella bestiolae CBS 10118 TaxID=1296100 RepID=A0A1B9FZN6_9TREE|nr:hypothetical protein I302_05689 [Kwoniella bestiolae CBS 10118]OCF24230.1 hypothetical protein I302_05689 [Kwoniella bestiolae CBS 10118]
MFASQRGEEGMSDSESSLSPSPSSRSRCFCGNLTQDGGIYCSVSCARSDAFSSLCYKPTSQPEAIIPQQGYGHDQHPSIASAISSSLSRNPSSASSTSIASSSSNQDVGEWNASHYRRLARADIRREERKEERRKRRAEGSLASSISTSRSTMMSVSSSASRSVPDLVGGHSHSRNPSIASSITSMSSSTWGLGGNLSRNPSSASTSSRMGGAGYGGNVNIGAAIMEDEDEEEWLQSEFSQPPLPAMPISSAPSSSSKRRPSHSRTGSKSHSSRKGRKHTPDPLPFGMGKDMRDVLEEIIQMEKSFLVSDNEHENDEDDQMSHNGNNQIPQTQPTGLFTSQFDRPPRTPSPVSSSKRRSSIAPGAPIRGHRSALSHSALPPNNVPHNPQPQRPPSLMGLHQSSLSESHTALYLATASPVAPGPGLAGRRSASPKLEYRRSITFTPDTAGPSISFDGLPPPRRIFDSPSGNITPMGGRRRLNLTPQAVHPSMDHWRFPSGSGSNMATPTRPSQSQIPTPDEVQMRDSMSMSIEPALLWPSQPPNLQPALFPCSPAVDTPELGSTRTLPSEIGVEMEMGRRDSSLSAPGSGMRLGELLGSGHGDVEMEMDEEDGSTEQGHGRTGYLPVFLEAEGFRAGDGQRLMGRGW